MFFTHLKSLNVWCLSKDSLTLGTGQRGNIARLGSNIVDNGGFEPGNDKVSSFVVNLVLNTKKTSVLDSTVTTINYSIHVS